MPRAAPKPGPRGGAQDVGRHQRVAEHALVSGAGEGQAGPYEKCGQDPGEPHGEDDRRHVLRHRRVGQSQLHRQQSEPLAKGRHDSGLG